MPREPLRLVWKRPAKQQRQDPHRQEPPSINDPSPPTIIRRPKPPPSASARCSGNCKSRRPAPVAIQDQDHEHDPWLGLGQEIQESVIERLPLSSLMTARAVSRAWNATLSAYCPRVPATFVVLKAWSSGQLIAYDTHEGRWAGMPESSSVPGKYSCLVGSAGSLVCATTDCPGRLVVGNPLTGTWDDVVFPSGWHSSQARPQHTLAMRSRSGYQIISLNSRGNAVVYDASQQPGQWSTLKRVAHYYRDHRVNGLDFVVGDDTLYFHRFSSSGNGDVDIVLVSYSLCHQSSSVTRPRWPVDLPSLLGKLIYCGGQLFLMDTICPDRRYFGYLLEPPFGVGVWRLVAASNEWVMEAKCPVMTMGRKNAFCCDGRDTLWAVLIHDKGKVESLVSYSLSGKEWAFHAACSFRVVPYASCVFLDSSV